MVHSEDHFSEEVCLGVGFPSQVSSLEKVESASAESRISEQILCRQNLLNLCKFVVHLVTSNQRF